MGKSNSGTMSHEAIVLCVYLCFPVSLIITVWLLPLEELPKYSTWTQEQDIVLTTFYCLINSENHFMLKVYYSKNPVVAPFCFHSTKGGSPKIILVPFVCSVHRILDRR